MTGVGHIPDVVDHQLRRLVVVTARAPKMAVCPLLSGQKA